MKDSSGFIPSSSRNHPARPRASRRPGLNRNGNLEPPESRIRPPSTCLLAFPGHTLNDERFVASAENVYGSAPRAGGPRSLRFSAQQGRGKVQPPPATGEPPDIRAGAAEAGAHLPSEGPLGAGGGRAPLPAVVPSTTLLPLLPDPWG